MLYFAIIVSPFVGFDVYTSNMKQKKTQPKPCLWFLMKSSLHLTYSNETPPGNLYNGSGGSPGFISCTPHKTPLYSPCHTSNFQFYFFRKFSQIFIHFLFSPFDGFYLHQEYEIKKDTAEAMSLSCLFS